MKTALMALAISLAVASCSTTQVHSNLPPGSQVTRTTGTIQVLYSTPARPYEVLGVVSAKRYKPGWSDPTVSDAIPQLRDAAAQLGAEAVLVRSSRSNNDRHTVVEAEAIRFTDRPQAAPGAQAQPCETCKALGGE